MEEESLNIFPPSNSLSIDKIVFDKEPIINNNINILQVKNIILIDKTVQQSDIFLILVMKIHWQFVIILILKEKNY